MAIFGHMTDHETVNANTETDRKGESNEEKNHCCWDHLFAAGGVYGSMPRCGKGARGVGGAVCSEFCDAHASRRIPLAGCHNDHSQYSDDVSHEQHNTKRDHQITTFPGQNPPTRQRWAGFLLLSLFHRYDLAAGDFHERLRRKPKHRVRCAGSRPDALMSK